MGDREMSAWLWSGVLRYLERFPAADGCDGVSTPKVDREEAEFIADLTIRKGFEARIDQAEDGTWRVTAKRIG